MKKLMIGMMVAAFALGAFGEGEQQATPAKPALVSENLFGSIEVNSKSEFTMVAVPFEGFASQFRDHYKDENDNEVPIASGAGVPNNILVSDVIDVENLEVNDTLSVFKPKSANAEETYHNYIAREVQDSIYIPNYGYYNFAYKFWNASMIFNSDMSSEKSPDPDYRLVPVGSGVFVGRDEENLVADGADGYSIFAWGQIPNYDYTQSVELNVGKTILSAPGELAYGDIQGNIKLNAIEWGNTDQIKGLKVWDEDEDYGEIYLDSLPQDADIILCYDPNVKKTNTLAARVQFINYKGTWYKVIEDGVASSNPDDAVIPAGLSFWYIKQAGSTVTLKWPSKWPSPPESSDGNN